MSSPLSVGSIGAGAVSLSPGAGASAAYRNITAESSGAWPWNPEPSGISGGKAMAAGSSPRGEGAGAQRELSIKLTH